MGDYRHFVPDDCCLSGRGCRIYLGFDMTEEPAKPKTLRKKKWVGLTVYEVRIILGRHERRLNAQPRYADEGRLFIFDVQNILKEKNI